MNAILEQINSTGKVFVEFAWPMLVQSSVLTAVLLLADLALRRKVRAVFRYWLWMIVLVKLILPTSLSSPLSVGYWFGDELKYKDIGRATTGAEAVVGTQKPAIVKEVEPQSAGAKAMMEPAAVDAAGPIVAETTAGEAMASVTQVTWEGIVFVVWAAVAAAMVLLLVQRAVFVCGLVRQGRDANNLMKDVLDYCRGQMGVRGKVGLKVSANATSPAVCGLFRPVILVPQNLGSELGSSHLRVVLLHELAHIKRGDLWVNLVQTVLQIVYFYNPLLWAANAVIRRVREQAVDESVLVAMGEKAQQYPQTLIDVAKLAFKRPALSLRLIGVVESKSALKGRIKHILNRPMPRSAKLGILGLVGVLIFGAVALPMAKFERGPAGFVVRGTVTDAETGKSVGGAKVGDVNEYAGGKQWTTSDANGNYSYKTWYEEHGVKAEADGYKRQDKGFGTKLFGKEKEKVIDFMLVPEKDKNESEFKATKPTEDTEKNQRDGSAKFQPLVKIDVTEKDLQNTFEFTRMPQGFGLKGIRYFSRLGPNRFKLTVFYETGLPVEEIQAVDSEGNMHPSIEKAVGLGNAEGIFTFSADKLAGIVLGSREESSGQNLPTNINKFSATLPNGVTVELVGICEHPSEGKQWWRPDGSKLEEKPWEKINGSVSPGWGKKACEFALKLAYPTEQEPGYYVKVESQGSVASGVTHTTATGHLNWLAVELPSKLEKTNITVAIASGKWQTQFSRSASEQGGVYAESSILGKGVAWFSPSSTDGKTSLTVSHGFTELETRAVAIDSSGHEHAGQYQSALFKSDSDTRTLQAFFELPLDEIKEFRLQTRPYEKFVFKNVSLKPGFKTDVEVRTGEQEDRGTGEDSQKASGWVEGKPPKQIPMPEDIRSPRDFSWFPDSRRVAMRLVETHNKKVGGSVIAIVDVENLNVKILSEPNIKHCNPACAPDGRTIAYIGPMGEHSTIWTMDVNGENKRPLVNVKCWHRPVWSPDSKRLVFTERDNDIWVVNADGSGLKQLTSGPGARSCPKWSPDGNLIAFQANDTIWLMNADGSNQRLLAEIVSERGYGPIGDWDDFFDWSPDGKQIVFAYRPIPPEGKHVTHDGGMHPYQIWIVNIDGSNKHCLTPEDLSCGNPIWALDKRYILYESIYKWVVTKTGNGPYPRRNLWMLDLMEKKKQQLTNVGMITEFALSPDGRKVIFSTEGDRSIFVLEDFFSDAIQSTNLNPASADTSDGKHTPIEELTQTAKISKQPNVQVEGERH